MGHLGAALPVAFQDIAGATDGMDQLEGTRFVLFRCANLRTLTSYNVGVTVEVHVPDGLGVIGVRDNPSPKRRARSDKDQKLLRGQIEPLARSRRSLAQQIDL